MPIVVNTNSAATTASLNLGRSNEALLKSLGRLSSGKRITSPADDAGGLAVALKLASKTNRTSAVIQNVQNGISYLQIQDGALGSIGKTLDRIAELRTMAQDVTKNTGDIKNYSKEFIELQSQLQQIRHTKLNGKSVFSGDLDPDNLPHEINAEWQSRSCQNPKQFIDFPGGRSVAVHQKYSRSLTANAEGIETLSSISISVVNLSDVLDVSSPDKRYDSIWDPSNDGRVAGDYKQGITLGNIDSGTAADNRQTTFGDQSGGISNDGFLSSILAVSMAQITYCIEKLSDARAENGAETNRALQVVDLLQSNLTNLEAAHGLIMDADIALESTNSARQNVLVQAGAFNDRTGEPTYQHSADFARIIPNSSYI
jgi:flagellin-like hook-associated protein FlgL